MRTCAHATKYIGNAIIIVYKVDHKLVFILICIINILNLHIIFYALIRYLVLQRTFTNTLRDTIIFFPSHSAAPVLHVKFNLNTQSQQYKIYILELIFWEQIAFSLWSICSMFHICTTILCDRTITTTRNVASIVKKKLQNTK